MMAGSHVALGGAAWLACAPHLGLPALSPVLLGLAITGALLPDIDHPRSWVGRRVRPLSDVLGALFGHRGVTHSLLALVGCAALLLHGAVPRAVAAPLAVGYLSHLVADLLTPGGLRLLWPLRNNFALPLVRTGSPFEPLVVALVLAWVGSATFSRPDLRAAWCATGLPGLWNGAPAGHVATAPITCWAPARIADHPGPGGRGVPRVAAPAGGEPLPRA